MIIIPKNPGKVTVDPERPKKNRKENPDFKGFKKKEIEPRLNELMWQMFGGIVATGENAWAPLSGVLPSGVSMGDDTPNEGFGDSDEHSNENEGIPPNEVVDEFDNMCNSFYMNYDTPKLSEEAQRRIATIVTQVEHSNYDEEEKYVLSSLLVHHATYFTMQPRTTHDSRIFLQALRKQELKFPHPSPVKYYLVDSGYPQMAGFLGPYRGERYHLLDFRRGNHQISGKKETFNHGHSSLRSMIERTFGVWKKMLRLNPSTQSTIVSNLIATVSNLTTTVVFNLTGGAGPYVLLVAELSSMCCGFSLACVSSTV
ncbi:hypothetical protein PVK06_020111 [Gossypium arboreum]|uniref:DDE Tnp4 domain-containing protein n=1 Tax=Gossypium arboreum TaxID=29729 RepID=A0ABR0PM04_GOSAR|nr:hypothetical protein PVK06_020111 [Gossypium arboreum]